MSAGPKWVPIPKRRGSQWLSCAAGAALCGGLNGDISTAGAIRPQSADAGPLAAPWMWGSGGRHLPQVLPSLHPELQSQWFGFVASALWVLHHCRASAVCLRRPPCLWGARGSALWLLHRCKGDGLGLLCWAVGFARLRCQGGGFVASALWVLHRCKATGKSLLRPPCV